MSSLKLSGTTLVRRLEGESGRALGKPQLAQVSERFSLTGSRSPQQVLEDAIDAALAAGWTADFRDPDGWIGSKTLTTGRANIGISLTINDGQHELVVNLTHDEGPPQ